MPEPTVISISVLIILAFTAVATWWGLLRLMDYALGVNFRDQIKAFSPRDQALYFGFRAVATAYLVATLFSRFV